VNFDFDDTQYALRDLAREVFTKESPPSRVRELWEDKPYDRRVWMTMADAGIVGLTVPESYGGAGLGSTELALVFEEAGRTALPDPLLETTGVAAPLLAAGPSDVAERWLPQIAAGKAIVAVQAPGEPLVAWGAEADLVIVERDGAPFAVERGAVEATPVAALDPARPLATVDADPDALVALDASTWRTAFLRGVTGSAATLNGIAMGLLERTVGYVKDREQFGVPVGSFQAVKHKAATMHASIELSRPAAWYAAHAIDEALADAEEAAHVAKAAAAETEALCNTEALQCHGGIGFTWEDDLHLWLKRGIVLRGTWGTARQHRRHVVSAMMST
jgi:alkylation response protein AidB-like acyl-CoA dehydrogenase